MAFWNTSKFKKLQKEWYEKLDKSGFKDVERMSEPHQDTVAVNDQVAVAEYYRRVTSYLHKGDFKQKPREFAIWFLHSEGFSEREISIAIGISQSSISRIIGEYRKLM